MAIARFRLVACVTLFILLVAADRSGAQGSPLASLDWQVGPTKGDLGGIASIDVPDGYRFVGPADARKFMELTAEHPPDGRRAGRAVAHWRVRAGSSCSTFSSGWATSMTRTRTNWMLTALLQLDSGEGTEEGNKTRRERGWSTMQILGWQQAPFYDTVTNNLTWSINAQFE